MGGFKVTDKALFSVHNLKKHFPVYSGVFRKQSSWIKALDGISFSIQTGEVLGLVGESGSGKSTAARAAIRLIEPTEGEIFFCGENFLQASSQQLQKMRKEIQMVFQDPYSSLNPRKTIMESLGEALRYHKITKNEDERIQVILKTLDLVGLPEDSLYRYPHEFSGGQQQRLCIGRAIALRPKLIICDEAVSALDVSVQAQILNLLKDLKEELQLSYLFISHDLSVVRYICDRILVMKEGIIVESAESKELFNNPQHSYTKELMSASPIEHPRDRSKIKI